jgi:TonB family protein
MMENRAKYRRLLVTAALLISASPHALATNIKVIANSTVKADSISAAELKSVFLEERSSLDDGTHVEPVLKRGGPIHEAFLHAYLGRSDDDLQTYYRALVFTGRASMPRELGSDAEVVAYVARTRGAIGYVSADTNTEGVKTLAIVQPENNTPRRLITRIEPDYPETLKRLGIGGTVRLQVTISAKGNVQNVELLGGNPILGESAISAVKQWVYATSHSRTVAEVSIPFDSHR